MFVEATMFIESLKRQIKFILKRKLLKHFQGVLKVQSCKLYNNTYMIALTQIKNNEILASVAVLVLKLSSRKVLIINRKNNTNC